MDSGEIKGDSSMVKTKTIDWCNQRRPLLPRERTYPPSLCCTNVTLNPPPPWLGCGLGVGHEAVRVGQSMPVSRVPARTPAALFAIKPPPPRAATGPLAAWLLVSGGGQRTPPDRVDQVLRVHLDVDKDILAGQRGDVDGHQAGVAVVHQEVGAQRGG